MDNVYQGFDQVVLQQIKDYLNPAQSVTELQVQEIPSGNSKKKQPLENGQRYMENASTSEALRVGKNKITALLMGTKITVKRKTAGHPFKKLRQI